MEAYRALKLLRVVEDQPPIGAVLAAYGILQRYRAHAEHESIARVRMYGARRDGPGGTAGIGGSGGQAASKVQYLGP